VAGARPPVRRILAMDVFYLPSLSYQETIPRTIPAMTSKCQRPTAFWYEVERKSEQTRSG